MWRSKKFILAVSLAAVVLAGSIGGVVLAADNGTEPEAKGDALLSKVCAIYQEKTGVTLNMDALKESFAEAQNEMLTEAMKEHLQSLVDKGRMTQDEADRYLEWWQARPDVPAGIGFCGPGGFRGMGRRMPPMRQEE